MCVAHNHLDSGMPQHRRKRYVNIPRYVEPVVEAETISVEDALDNLQRALSDAYAAEDRLKHLLKEVGLMS